jgi:beta-phosphoglucomutase-like phosphatase (HAD superfamily)
VNLPPRVSAIVFDCDGLLLDTETCWSRAEASIFADHGFGFGARELLELLGGRIPIAVATNSPRALLAAALTSSGLNAYFEVCVAADEVERPKPDPQLYLEAFARLQVSPNTGVALEDSSTGVAAARAAGAFLITVPSQPGKALDGDYVTASLRDPVLTEWAQALTCS